MTKCNWCNKDSEDIQCICPVCYETLINSWLAIFPKDIRTSIENLAEKEGLPVFTVLKNHFEIWLKDVFQEDF